jgi:hypothetical protein
MAFAVLLFLYLKFGIYSRSSCKKETIYNQKVYFFQKKTIKNIYPQGKQNKVTQKIVA